ncbi:DUF3138 family protein [Paucibacter sp. KCTC 42545]|uniref:DUF3138 family protein n=1 Tax=Paucibacter sp. KCTC 42545 TaxID=1768242 RepID=UPI000733A8EA|nr:DUF3138 family protein [Paucibacter sp. KCTC 42545]ALT77030.1 hypothetical protein AT984_07335 [Paucibacter sp. KCTC 42545]
MKKKAFAALPLALSLALAAAYPGSALAQSNEELLKELRALRDRVGQLEDKLKAAESKPAATAPQWGMTPQQVQDFNRIAVKTEALEDAQEMLGMKNLKVSGFLDPTFIYNRNNNSAGFQLFNKDAYGYDNGYFGMAALDITKEMEGGTKWRLTLAPERGAGASFNTGSIVHEASVNIPLGDLQTRLWLGQIPDWTGYEITLPPGNKLITHNLLFDFTAPTAYTGAVMDLTIDKWLVKVGLANVNNARKSSGNKTPALIYRVDYAKGEFQGFGFTGLHGKAYNYAADALDANGDLRFAGDNGRDTRVDMLELDAYFIRGDWTLQGQLSWGQQRKSAIFNEDGQMRDATWTGVSALAAYKFMPRWEMVARADYLSNSKNGGGLFGYSSDDGRNGLGRGYGFAWDDANPDPEVASKGANRYELSLGFNYLFNANTTFKFEYRFDGSDRAVFMDQSTGNWRKNNHLLGTSMVVNF